jgi:hypothetical protein
MGEQEIRQERAEGFLKTLILQKAKLTKTIEEIKCGEISLEEQDNLMPYYRIFKEEN